MTAGVPGAAPAIHPFTFSEREMDGAIQKFQAVGIFSLNIDDLDIDELERRLEMAVANPESLEACVKNTTCKCDQLASCGQYC